MSEHLIELPPRGNASDGAALRVVQYAARRRFLAYLRIRWWLPLLAAVACALGVFAYETLRPETYESRAQLLLGDVQVNVANVFSEDPLNYFGTQIELLKSSRLQGDALGRAGIPPASREEDLVKVDVARPLGTSVLMLQATGRDAAVTQGFLKALIEGYLAFKKESRATTSDDIAFSLGDQLAKREASLKAEQDKWTDFQRTNNVAVLEEEGKAAALYLSELNLQLAKARVERDLLQGGSGFVDRPGHAPAGVSPDGTNGSAVFPGDSSLRISRVELALRRAELEHLVGERGEAAGRRLADEVSRLSKTVAALEEESRLQRSVELRDLGRRIEALEKTLPSWQARVREANERLALSRRLQANVEREQGFRDHLLGLFQNVDVGRTVQPERVSVLLQPTAAFPSRRFVALRISLAVLAGLGLGLGLVFAWHAGDDRFSSSADVQDQFSEPLLGLIPRLRRGAAGAAAFDESFRHLRSALLLGSAGSVPPGRVLVTSPGNGDGRTTVAENLARALARDGIPVLLVSGSGSPPANGAALPRWADVVRSRAGKGNGVPAEGDPACLQRMTWVAFSAGVTPGRDLSRAFESLSTRAACVIADCPPLLRSDEVSFLVPEAQLVLVVVRPFHTRMSHLRRTLALLRQRRAASVGLVMSGARQEDPGAVDSLALAHSSSSLPPGLPVPPASRQDPSHDEIATVRE